jgi:molybdopterin/thiamine biosynthesis adenylyltransferase
VSRITLAIPEPTWAELRAWVDDSDEVAGVLVARVIDDENGTTILARQLHRAPRSTYIERRPDGLALRSTGWVPAVRDAGRDGSMALFVHTHPDGPNEFSSYDDIVDEELEGPFCALSGLPLYGALLISGGAGPAIARLRRPNSPPEVVETIRVVGERLMMVPPAADGIGVGEVHDRQLRALGAAGQRVLRSLRVGIVGAGGTGSPVAEQMLRLGVGSLVVVDDDVVTPSTLSRGSAFGKSDIGRPKVDVIAEMAARIGIGTDVQAVRGDVGKLEIAKELRHCDVVFCCVDGHGARLVLNRWAYWHLAPVIDVGVLISGAADATIAGIDGRLTWLAPGAACLLCRGRIDPALAYAERLDPEERRRLAGEGYAPDLDEPQASVVTYTTAMAAMAGTELLNRLFGLADNEPTEFLVRFRERATSRNRRSPRTGCFCGTAAMWGQGGAEPYLDLTWTG